MLQDKTTTRFATLLGIRVGNQQNSVKITQSIIKNNGKIYDSSVYTISRKNIAILKSKL